MERYFRLVIKPGKQKEDAIALLRARLSAFVLISNDPRRTALELLREYKEQMSVEQGFRFIKEPRHIGPVFLKRPDRIEAFAYVQAIALLVYTLIQKKIRDSLAMAERPLQVSGAVLWRGITETVQIRQGETRVGESSPRGRQTAPPFGQEVSRRSGRAGDGGGHRGRRGRRRERRWRGRRRHGGR